MKNQHSSMDGFVPRRTDSQLGDHHMGRPQSRPIATGLRAPAAPMGKREPSPLRRSNAGLNRIEVTESLSGIDAPEHEKRTKKKFRGGGGKSHKKLFVKLFIALIVVAILAICGWVGYRAMNAGTSIFKGNLFDIIQSEPLKQDLNGRSNILIFGTSEDDGPDHGGANLTDSLMVVSINQDKKDAYLLSVPRDLWVEYGAACNSGYKGKINEVYTCYSNDGEEEAKGADALKAKVGEVLGMEIQYYAHVNYSVVREAVDAVGGVEITIESPDPRGILDRNFDWMCGYKCNYVKYANGPTGIMDGEHALALARARGDDNGQATYGLGAGNFDREKNQQKILQALREKAASAGTLTNVGKVTSLLEALGNNLRTNFETKEIRTLMSLGGDIQAAKIQSISLVDEKDPVVTTAMIGASSVVRPIAGVFDYSEIRSYVKKQLSSDPSVKEEASIVVLNGSGVAGAAQAAANKLTEQGLNVGDVGNAPEGTYKKVELFQIGEDKPATKAKLEVFYGVKVSTAAAPVAASANTNFIVIIGQAPASD